MWLRGKDLNLRPLGYEGKSWRDSLLVPCSLMAIVIGTIPIDHFHGGTDMSTTDSFRAIRFFRNARMEFYHY